MSESSGSSLSVLVVGEHLDPSDLEERIAEVTGGRATVLSAASVEGMTTALDGVEFDCVVVSRRAGAADGAGSLERVRDRDRSVPVIVLGDGGRDRPPTQLFGRGPVTYVPGDDRVSCDVAEAVGTLATTTARGPSADVPDESGSVVERFEALFGDSLDPAVAVEAVDGTGVVRATNVGFRETFCVDESAVGRPLSEVLGVAGEVTDPIEGRAAREEVVEEEVTRSTADGERTFEVRAAPIAEDGGVVVYRRGEDREHLRRFEALIHNSSDILSILNRDGTFEYMSPAVESTLGYTAEEMEGELSLDYIHPEDRQEVATEFFGDPVEWDGERRKHIFRFEGPDGGWRIVESIAQSKMSDPRIEGVVVNSRDVTEREKRKEELERFETIVETIPLGLFALDDDARMVWANDRFLELMGRSEDEVIGTQFLEFIREGLFEEQLVEDYLKSVRQLLSSDVDSETVMEEVYYHPPSDADVARDEYIFDVHFGLLPLVDGEYQGTVNAFRDITERKRYQREIEEKNERLQQFASFVSHDLRNPLNVAQGYVELAKTGDTDAVDEIEVSLNRMERLIEELLTMAREGRDVDDPVPTTLGSVARSAWGTVDTKAADLLVETDRVILADEVTLQQAFENLFRNAVEHGGDDVTVTVGDLDDGAGFYVEDDGPGIPEEERDQVLELGYTTNDQGTGFGLGIVRQIADGHGWEVSAVEGTDDGARFEFRSVETRDGE